MSILEYDVIIKLFLMLYFLVTFSAIIIYVHVRYRRNAVSTVFTIASILLLVGLFCVLIDIAILEMNFERTFRLSGCFLILLSSFFFTVSLCIHVFNRKRRANCFFSTPDLKSVFNAIDDLALVFDYRGAAAEANHPEMLEGLFPNANSLKDVLSELRKNSERPVLDDLDDCHIYTKEKLQSELQLAKNDAWYNVSFLPILSGEDYLGSIIIMKNITVIKQTEQLLRLQNGYLTNANQKLINYVQIASVLEAENERLKLMERIQADLINKIENAVSLVQKIQKEQYSSQKQFKEDLTDASDLLRSVYKEVRCSIGKILGAE